MPMPIYNTIPLPLQWNQLILEAIRCSSTSHPLAVRALAMVHTAMYDVWSVFDNCAISTSTVSLINILNSHSCTRENIQKVYSYAAFRVLRELFRLALPPENRSFFQDFMCELNYNPDDTSLEISAPQGIGNLMAKVVLECRWGDGANSWRSLATPGWLDYTGYQPLNSPEKVHELKYWQPTNTKTSDGEMKEDLSKQKGFFITNGSSNFGNLNSGPYHSSGGVPSYPSDYDLSYPVTSVSLWNDVGSQFYKRCRCSKLTCF